MNKLKISHIYNIENKYKQSGNILFVKMEIKQNLKCICL